MSSSDIRRHRNARAIALTMALSTRGRGAHGAASGVTTSSRPTGDIDIHGTHAGCDGRPVFVATWFDCSDLAEQASFTPLWHPPSSTNSQPRTDVI